MISRINVNSFRPKFGVVDITAAKAVIQKGEIPLEKVENLVLQSTKVPDYRVVLDGNTFRVVNKKTGEKIGSGKDFSEACSIALNNQTPRNDQKIIKNIYAHTYNR